MGEHIHRRSPRPTIAGGDFNAHAVEWGSPYTDSRGDSTLQWGAGLGLVLMNRGRVSTFAGSRGESIIDLTWATPAAAQRVKGWHVDAGSLGELSDHKVIRMELVSTPAEVQARQRRLREERRWALKKLDPDALETSGGPPWPPGAPTPAHGGGASTLRRRWPQRDSATREAPSAWPSGGRRPKPGKSSSPPWTGIRGGGPIRSRRKSCDRGPPQSRKPWTSGSSTRWCPPSSLQGIARSRRGRARQGWVEELGVSGEEMALAFARLKGRPRAPGPDGVPGRVWAAAAPVIGGRVRQLFTSCLREGAVPESWKRARLVLLRKEGKPAENPSAYRPICLLDEVGKLFERVIASRIVRWLSRDGPNLSSGQYGFREGRSTVGAIMQVRALSERLTADGKVALSVSLDIANAFNSLPWGRVVGALKEHFLLPPYLVAVAEDYFRDRQLEYRDKSGLQQHKE
ncbi:PREDICTED: uncharacterized protein LOC108758832, partial [Trachymyrmex cornetzi]|uniref:uncharacterized protein LOC108758832 n=1 Tax=Trachymyrmex cornetzi TaxID=471704 RepID=UPI00084EE6C7